MMRTGKKAGINYSCSASRAVSHLSVLSINRLKVAGRMELAVSEEKSTRVASTLRRAQ
jgi:hypothetical protein